MSSGPIGAFIADISETQEGRGAFPAHPVERTPQAKTSSIHENCFFIEWSIAFHLQKLKGNWGESLTGKKMEEVAPSANSDFFGKPFLASGTPANPMSEPEGRVLDLQ